MEGCRHLWTGSNAPGSTEGHNPRSSLPCGDKVPVGNNFPDKESISQEYQASYVVDKAPQQRAGPFLFETPRIPKSDGLRADPLRHMNRSARRRHFIIAATACSEQASRRPYCAVRREEHPPANVNSYAPRAESGILGCDRRGRHFITAAAACSEQASRRAYCTFSQGGPPTCERKPLRPTSRTRYTGLRWVRKDLWAEGENLKAWKARIASSTVQSQHSVTSPTETAVR